MKWNGKIKGSVCGILAAVTYGMNPLFGLPLYERGLTTTNVLLYRFFFAFLILSGYMLVRKEPLKADRKQLFLLIIEGGFLALTCLFLYLSLHLLDSGIAATILFVYPLMVCGIMFFMFHVRQSRLTLVGMFLSISGIMILSLGNMSGKFSILGLIYVLLSALTYAIYMILLKVTSLKELSSTTLTYYAFLFAVPIYFLASVCGKGLQPLPDLFSFGCVLGLALLPATLSFLFTAVAIRHIGPTKTAILGALEPVTSIFFGIAVFHEHLTWLQMIGVLIILGAVTMVVCAGKPVTPEK